MQQYATAALLWVLLLLAARPAAATSCSGAFTFTTTAAANAALAGCEVLLSPLVLNLDAGEPDLAPTAITMYVATSAA